MGHIFDFMLNLVNSAWQMNNRTSFISSVAVLSVSFILISIPRSLTHPPSLSLGNDVRNVALVSSLDLILMWHLHTHGVLLPVTATQKLPPLTHTNHPHWHLIFWSFCSACTCMHYFLSAFISFSSPETSIYFNFFSKN